MSRFPYMRVLYTFLLFLCVVLAVVLATKIWMDKRVVKWKTLDSVYFTIRYPPSWRIEVKHGNTLYIRPPDLRSGGVKVAVWSAPTVQDKEEVARWAREEALALSVDGEYSPVYINVGNKQLNGIKFKIRNVSSNLFCYHSDLKLSRQVIIIGIVFSNESELELMKQIIQSIKIKEEEQSNAK